MTSRKPYMSIKLERMVYPGQETKWKISKPYQDNKAVIVDETELDALFTKIQTIKNTKYIEKPHVVLDKHIQDMQDDYEKFKKTIEQTTYQFNRINDRLIEQDDRLTKHGKSIIDLYDKVDDIDETTTEMFKKVEIEFPQEIKLIREILQRRAQYGP